MVLPVELPCPKGHSQYPDCIQLPSKSQRQGSNMDSRKAELRDSMMNSSCEIGGRIERLEADAARMRGASAIIGAGSC